MFANRRWAATARPRAKVHDTYRGMFRLLVPASATDAVGAPRINLLGRPWVIAERAEIPGQGDGLPYTCVSYAWGAGRVPSPFDPLETMSDRTVRVIEATLRACPATALWVDALCVPARGLERTICLRNMGAIYAGAQRVVVVLSEAGAALVELIHQEQPVDEATLLAFEKDPWVTRAWTYQEVVNSRALSFVVETGGDVFVKGHDLLREVNEAISTYKKTRGYDMFDIRERHPRLDSIEDLLVDWMIADYQGRSAYQAMSDLARRSAERHEDRYFALLGAISSAVLDDRDAAELEPAEQFMRVCESKGDFSFIYSTAQRSTVPGQSWRPASPDAAHPVLPWHSLGGSGQPGYLHPTHLRLDGMCRLVPGPIDAAASADISAWHDRGRKRSSAGSVPEVVLGCLRQAGFSGCGTWIELQNGYFFPQWMPDAFEDAVVLIATKITWIQGAPGLLVREAENGMRHCGAVGVFVGKVPKVSDSFDLT